MLTFKQGNRIKKSIKYFLSKEQRLNYELTEIIQILKQESNFNYLLKFLQAKQTVPHIFKFLILIHRLMIERCPHSEGLLTLINKLEWFTNGDFEEMMQQRLIKPYQLYLQKRLFFQIYTESGKNIEEDQIRVYKLLNLLHAGTSFVNMIYTLGRYYKREWVVQFNVAICMDLRTIYAHLTESLLRPISKEMLEQIEKLHEKLYLAFYNCYFHKHLKTFVPKWIKTDYGVTPKKKEKRSISKRKTSESLSSKNKSTIESQKWFQMSSSTMSLESSSCFLFNEPQSQTEKINYASKIEIDSDIFEENDEHGQDTNQRRSQLIKDMEIIVSMIDA